MSSTFMVYNGPAVTTAAPVKVTTGTAVKTMLQLATSANVGLTVVEWGISFDGSALATPIEVELIDTTVGATITQYVAADIVKWSDPTGPASQVLISTTAQSGYSASAEGTVVATTRQLDTQLISPMSQYVKQFPLGIQPALAVSRFLRIRVTAAAAVNAYCYVIYQDI